MTRRIQPLRSGFTLVELMVVIAIIGLLASVLATSVVSKMTQARRDLDKKVLQDLYSELSMTVSADDKRNRRLLATGAMAELRGRDFWEGCFRYKILSADMLPKIVSHAGPDIEMDRRALDDAENFVLDPMACSWTAPQGNECLAVMMAKGKARRVAICANERNWFNHDGEVLTMWSDGQVAEYVMLIDMKHWGYDITEEQWDAPGELFGKVKPFDGVFD